MAREIDYEFEDNERYDDNEETPKHYCEDCGAPIYEFDTCYYMKRQNVWICEDCAIKTEA